MKNVFGFVVVAFILLGTTQQSKAFTNNTVFKLKEWKLNPDTLESKKVFSKGIDGMVEMAGKGKNVFIECTDSVVLDYAHQALNEWKYWKIVNNKELADFTIQIKQNKENEFKWKLYAVFVSPAGKEIYKTKPSQKFGIGKLKARQTTTNYLINNIIRPFFDL